MRYKRLNWVSPARVLRKRLAAPLAQRARHGKPPCPDGAADQALQASLNRLFTTTCRRIPGFLPILGVSV
jgi:hypothetical protein